MSIFFEVVKMDDTVKKYEFKPNYYGSSSGEVIGLEKKFAVFSNHCYPTDQNIEIDIKNQSRRREGNTLNLHFGSSEMPSIRYCSRGAKCSINNFEGAKKR